MFSNDLLLNAVVSGLLLGGFYAAVTAGVAISFGILDIVNIAHPAFIILGSYIAYAANARFGLDPIATGIVALPAFYALGSALYQAYYLAFERRGRDSLRGLAFFFGILFITEVAQRQIDDADMPARRHVRSLDVAVVDPEGEDQRMLVPCVMSLAMLAALWLLLLTLGVRPAGLLGR